MGTSTNPEGPEIEDILGHGNDKAVRAVLDGNNPGVAEKFSLQAVFEYRTLRILRCSDERQLENGREGFRQVALADQTHACQHDFDAFSAFRRDLFRARQCIGRELAALEQVTGEICALTVRAIRRSGDRKSVQGHGIGAPSGVRTLTDILYGSLPGRPLIPYATEGEPASACSISPWNDDGQALVAFHKG